MMKEKEPDTAEKPEKKTEAGEAEKKSRLEKPLLFLRENQWFWGIAFIVVIFLLFMSHFHLQPPPEWQIGVVATKEVRAPFDLQLQDEIATESKKEEAGAKVSPVYDWDTEMGERLQESLSRIFQKARGIIQEGDDAISNKGLSKEEEKAVRQKMKSALEELLGPDVTRYAFHQLQKEGFRAKKRK